MDKNAFRLNKKAGHKSYDWWWHSFVGYHEKTGNAKPFFIEYFVINPNLWNGKIVYGQHPQSKQEGMKPCYAMLKAGTWGNNKAQLHNFYGIDQFSASTQKLDCKIGNNTLTEKQLNGKVSVSKEEASKHPEWMSDSGSMDWNLSIEKDLQFDVGYGSSGLLNWINAFHMYWHIQGMRCKLKGTVIFNGERYNVEPDTSFGYQDKNWGRNYTTPWIWLNCNNFVSKKTGKPIDASLDLGGGCPKVLGIPLNRRILTAFYYKGNFIEFNFSKFWKYSHQEFNSNQDNKYLYWNVTSESRRHRIEINFRCKKSKMIFANYENPKGDKHHNKLWNGGHAEGSLKYYKKEKGTFTLIDELTGSLGGGEYGDY